LEGVGAGARLVRAHARAHLACLVQRLERLLRVLARIDGVEPRDYVEAVLVERDALVLEADRLAVLPGAPQYPEFLVRAHSRFARRRLRTPPASVSSNASVSSQPMHASVIDTPCASALPG